MSPTRQGKKARPTPTPSKVTRVTRSSARATTIVDIIGGAASTVASTRTKKAKVTKTQATRKSAIKKSSKLVVDQPPLTDEPQVKAQIVRSKKKEEDYQFKSRYALDELKEMHNMSWIRDMQRVSRFEGKVEPKRDFVKPFELMSVNFRWSHQNIIYDLTSHQGNTLPALYRDLEMIVGWFMNEHLNNDFTYDNITASTRQRWEAFCPTAEQMLVSDDNSRSGLIRRPKGELIRADIWHLLWEHLFSPDCVDKWRDEWIPFRDLIYGRLEQNRTDFPSNVNQSVNAIRYGLFRHFYARYDLHTSPQRLYDILRNALHELYRPNESPPEYEAFNLWRVVNAAIGLDFMMVLTPLEVRMCFTDSQSGEMHGFPFRSDKNEDGHVEMQSVGPAEGTPVDMIITPRLEIWGTYGNLLGHSFGEPRTKTLTVIPAKIGAAYGTLQCVLDGTADDLYDGSSWGSVDDTDS